jgi:hypothetical protein
MTGDARTIKIHLPLGYFFDNHMHIMSGNCAPLPLIWDKIPGLNIVKPDRENVNFLSKKLLGSGGRLQSQDTYSISKKAVEDLDSFFEKHADEEYLLDYYDCLNSKNRPFTLQFVMTMDMDYTHIAGYYGQMLYHLDKERNLYYYYLRNSGLSSEDQGRKVYLAYSEVELYENFNKQITHTKKACIENPFRLLTLYHYDPRRWNYKDKEAIFGYKSSGNEQPFITENISKGTWNYPFTELAGRKKANQPGLFIGMKMYTPQGYRPLDDKCRFLDDYYKRCEDEQIPILNHCSAGGNTIPENLYYMEYIHGSMGNAGSSDSDATSVRITRQEDPIVYFNDNFVHPKAWRSVLCKYRNLRICLAHFGASEWQKGHLESEWIKELIALLEEFPNVYTDIACFDYKGNYKNFGLFLRSLAHKNILHKIMFGTDWYMSLVTALEFNAHRIWDFSETGIMRGRTYTIFIKQWKCFLDEVDPSLWPRFSIINTFNFYDLGNKILLNNLELGYKKLSKPYIKKSDEKLRYDTVILARKKCLESLPQKINDLKEHYGIKDEK